MSFLTPLGTGLQGLGLALLVGGLLALGAFTAPVLFKSFARPEAGDAMMTIFKRYDIILLVSIGLIVGGEICRWIPTGMPAMSFFVIARYVIILVLVGMTAFSTLGLTPKMVKMYGDPSFRTEVELRETFNKTHKLSERLAKMELLLGVILLLMTPFVETSKLP